MNEPTITAEDLVLYAMDLLSSSETARVDLLLRSSQPAREELALIRGDLAAFALGTPQHTPPALTRQRLLKQVARERRTVPISLGVPADELFVPDLPIYAPDPHPSSPEPARPAETMRTRSATDAAAAGPRTAPASNSAENDRFPRRQDKPQVILPRVVSEPEHYEAVDLEFSANAPSDTYTPSTAASPVVPAAPPTATPRTTAMFEQQFRGEPAYEDPIAAGGSAAARRAAQRSQAPEAASAEPASSRHFEPAPDFAFHSFGEGVEPRSSRRGVNWLAWTGWGLAAALGATALIFVKEDYSLQQRLDAQSATLRESVASAQRAEAVLQTLSSPASQRFVLMRADAVPAPAGRIAYLPERGSLVFQGSNLDPLPAYKTYELWLIPVGEGRQPIPAGTFRPDVRGYASLVLPPLPPGSIAGNFGVTVEDGDGSTTPTLPILLIGQQS